MTPKRVLQERIDNALSHARPRTPEEDSDDLNMMEMLYQEDLRLRSIASGTADGQRAGAGGVDNAPGGSSATTPDI